jgi:hypothetical protein
MTTTMYAFCTSESWQPALFKNLTFQMLTPCFEDVVVLGVFNLFALVLSVSQIHALCKLGSLSQQFVDRAGLTVLSSRASCATVFQVILAACCAILPIVNLLLRHFNVMGSMYEFGDATLLPFELLSLSLESAAWVFLGLAMGFHAAYIGLIQSAQNLGFKAAHTDPKVTWRLPFLLVFALIVQSVKLRSDLIVTWSQWQHDFLPQPISYLDFFLHAGFFLLVIISGILSMCCSSTVLTAGAKRQEEEAAAFGLPMEHITNDYVSTAFCFGFFK